MMLCLGNSSSGVFGFDFGYKNGRRNGKFLKLKRRSGQHAV